MRRLGATAVLVIALGAASVAHTMGVAAPWPPLLVLAGAVVFGEAFEVRALGRMALPMSYAVLMVFGRVGTVGEAVLTIAAAEMVAAWLRTGSPVERLQLFLWRVALGAAGVASFHGVAERVGTSTTIELLAAVGAGAVAMLLVHEVGSGLLGRRAALSWRGRWADIALVSCGALMTLGYGGVAGKGDIGLWSLALFSVPLFASWYAFDRLSSAQATYWQTVHALSLAPELGGVVHGGHAQRVAELALEIGTHLDLSAVELETLEAAAYLHHIGDLCVDEFPRDDVLGDPDPFDAVDLSVKILRDTGHLADVAEVIEALPNTYRTPGSLRPNASGMPGAILKVVSAYDELAMNDRQGTANALAMLYSSPAYVYDPRVLAELERALSRRGELVLAD